jgi:acetyltransferase-like isoleucine patch superfamily enzyme
MKWSNQWFKLRLGWRRALARMAGAELGFNVRLARGVDFNLGGGFHNCMRPQGTKGSIRIAEQVWMEQGCVLWAFGGSIKLASSVFLGPYVVIYGHGGVEVGERTLVSMHCCILSSNHALPGKDEKIREVPDILLPTTIGRDCWLGAGVKVMGGVSIGEGCVIGAGAVVTRSIPAYSIALGVPARVIGQRAP